MYHIKTIIYADRIQCITGQYLYKLKTPTPPMTKDMNKKIKTTLELEFDPTSMSWWNQYLNKVKILTTPEPTIEKDLSQYVEEYMNKIKATIELELEVDVSAVHWENTGIGDYELGSERKIDYGEDLIEEVEISKITFMDVDFTSGPFFDKLTLLLNNDENFIAEVERHEKIEAERSKLESKLDRLEDKKYYD